MDTTKDKKPSYQDLEFENEKLKRENNQLRRLIFGQKRERFVPELNEDQLNLLASKDITSKSDKPETKHISGYSRKVSNKKKKKPVREEIPSHIPRQEIVIEPEEDITGLKKIGQEITEELEYEEAKFYVKRYIRPKYARKDDKGVAIGYLPTRPIEKGIAGPSLLSHILISKFVDHLPLYRQNQQFKRLGVEFAPSTMNGWVKSTTELLLPLFELERSLVLKANYLMVDETPIKVLDTAKPGTTHRGYYWVYYDPIGNHVFFDYRKRHSRDGPNTVLKYFQGHLQTDGYTGYNELASKPEVTPVGCMAHARRYFVEARDNDPERTTYILKLIQELYAIEKYARVKNLSHDDRYRLREKSSKPVMEIIKKWLNTEYEKVLPRSGIGGAIGYMLRHWSLLETYLTDGKLEIDNNLVENAIRPVALGRKNYLFAGSHKGAKRAAVIYTLVSNAKIQGKEPFSYLRDILSRIADHPYKNLHQLLPENWVK